MMGIKHGLVTSVVLLASCLQATIAIECGENPGIYTVFASQGELDSAVANCTVWVGSISVSSDWSGPLVLNNITNVTGVITTEPYVGRDKWPSSLLTSIEAPKLRYLGGMYFWNASNATSISLPKLEWVETLSVDQSVEREVIVDVPSLVNVTRRLEIFGNVPVISFPSLIETDSTYIASKRSLLMEDSFDYSASFPGIAVEFPVLVNAGLIKMIGNITSIEMPSLVSSSGGSERYFSRTGLESTSSDWYLLIWTTGNPLDVEFPSLWNVSDIFIAGNVKRFSFPALESITGTFKFSPSTNATFDPRPLQRAAAIDLSGKVTSYSLESLTYVDKMIIEPDEVINCEPAAEVWERMHPGYGADYAYDRTLSGYYYSCNGPVKKAEKHKPFPKVAVGLSVGIGIPVWFFFIFALWHSRKERKKAEEVAKIPPPDYDAEMAARSAGGGEVLPDYEPRRSQGSGGHTGSVIELVDMTRPAPHPAHPPGYEHAVGNGGEAGPTTSGFGDDHRERTVGEGQPRSAAGN